MRIARVALLALTFAAGCGGGGTTVSGPAPVPPPNVPTATTTLSLAIPNRPTTARSRAPRYLSDGTMAIAFYDGSTLLYVGNVEFVLAPAPTLVTLYAKSGSSTVTPGDCVRGNLTSTCTLSVTTTAGPHTFGITAYGELQGGVPEAGRRTVSDTGTPPTFTGLILSEGEVAVTLVGGTNPAQTMTLLGVADIAQWFGNQTASFNQSATIGYEIQDARSGQIVLPGNAYDNGPITITANPPGILTFTPITQTTPPAINGSQTFTVTCTSANGGDVTFTASAGTHPNTAYQSGLTYNSSNYSNGTLSTRGFRCFGS
jgi:hypothetical protein